MHYYDTQAIDPQAIEYREEASLNKILSEIEALRGQIDTLTKLVAAKPARKPRVRKQEGLNMTKQRLALLEIFAGGKILSNYQVAQLLSKKLGKEYNVNAAQVLLRLNKISGMLTKPHIGHWQLSDKYQKGSKNEL